MGLKKKLDTILVIDFEATCWRDKEDRAALNPGGIPGEAIEVGLALVDTATFEITQPEERIFVRPRYATSLSPFCTELTGITWDQIEHAPDWVAVAALLQAEYKIHKRTWASFGDYDRKLFRQMATLNDCRDIVQDCRHLNVKNLAALALAERKEWGTTITMGKLGLEFEGQLHSGKDDARNIAAMLVKILAALRRI